MLTAENKKHLLEIYSIEVSTNGFHTENISEQRFLLTIWFLPMLMFRMMMNRWVMVTWCWCWCLTWCWPDGDLLFLRCGLCLEPGRAQVHNLSFFLEIYLFSHLTKYDDCHEKEIEKENICLLQPCNVERRRFSLPSDILTLHDLLCHSFVCVT